jgi:N6-adenosine-specific RNA methylase IME4
MKNEEILTRSEINPVGFSTVLADPPWPEKGGGKIKRGADRHYDLMKVSDIISLPVGLVCASNAHLWLWTTNNYLPAALRAMEAWGFRYVTNFVWAKVTKNGVLRGGLGQYSRGAHELLLFGVRGKLPASDEATYQDKLTVVLAERGKHSAKPVEFMEKIEAISPHARIELFARNTRPGWFSVGSEEGHGENYLRADVSDAINMLAHDRRWLRDLTRDRLPDGEPQ